MRRIVIVSTLLFAGCSGDSADSPKLGRNDQSGRSRTASPDDVDRAGSGDPEELGEVHFRVAFFAEELHAPPLSLF